MMREWDRLGDSRGHPRTPGKCAMEVKAEARLGHHQPTSGPGSAMPTARQDRAAVGLEAGTFQHYQCRDWWPRAG